MNGNCIRTDRTYASVANAKAALDRALAKYGKDDAGVRWMIAVAPDGRYAPVVVGAEHALLAHLGVTVVG